MKTFEIVLPWPDSVLWPNARPCRYQLARAKKEYRAECAWEARRQGAAPVNAPSLHVDLVFFPPTRRRFDLDNALAAMKSGIDGLVDVLQVDDSQWTFSIAKAPKGQIGGVVKVAVSDV